MKKSLLLLAFIGLVAVANAITPVEISRGKGRASFNCCKGWFGKCAIYVADDLGGGVYSIPYLTTVYYDQDYSGPYLPGAYLDGSGRMRIDNVHITFTPSDCIDPETGALMSDCTPDVDEDMNFSLTEPPTPID